MKWFLRIALFLATNLALLLLFGIVLSVLQGVFGINLGNNGVLLAFALIFGMGGAFISLAISRWMAIRAMGVQVLDPKQGLQGRHLWVYQTVERLSQKAGLPVTPMVGVYDAPEINAFATGPSKRRSLVAVSEGLLRSMDQREAEAVLAHEVAHIANGDMVTLTLIQGVLNTMVIMAARIVGGMVDRWLSGDEENSGGIGYFVTVVVFEIIFGLLASIIVMAFSRWREFRADNGAADLVGASAMIAALKRLKADTPSEKPTQIAAFAINGGLGKWFSTHPPLDDRIAALEKHSGAVRAVI